MSYIRSNIAPESLAADAMSASGFRSEHIGADYDQISTNFLKTFGSSQHTGDLQWVFCFADSVVNRNNSLNIIRSQAVASTISEDAMLCLKNFTWMTGDSMPSDHFRRLLEL